MNIKVKFMSRQRPTPEQIINVELEGTLISMGFDCGETTLWSTGIVVTPDGKFYNVPIERLSLIEPFNIEEWQ